jgi:hypothetical protein
MVNIILIFFQVINIATNQLETGTQGSIDGYVVSIIFGIILSIAIILIQKYRKEYFKKGIKIIYFILFVFSILLYIGNFKYIYYVTIVGYKINDLLVYKINQLENVEYFGNNYVEKIYPILFYLMITINVVVCFINIFSKKYLKE